MNKSIFFDVDNTLVCREKNMISKSTIQAIKSLKKKNINIAIATGRSLAMVKQESFYDMFKTIISANGSLITVNDEVIYKEYMNQRLVRDLLTVFEKNQTPYCIHFLHESKGKLNQAWVAEFSIKYNMPLGYLEEDILNQIEKYKSFKLMHILRIVKLK
ncbi:MAG: HAD hydrolase family protein [Turicibacter sanguinis]